MAKNNYYDTLGVSKSATDAEIKSAYRKLAREYHPDVAKDKANAEAKFKEINEAYQVLSDKTKRAQYDQYGDAAGFNGGGTGGFGQGAGFDPFGGFGGQGPGGFKWTYSTNGQDFGEFDPFDIFEQVFGFRGFGGRQRKGRDVKYALNIEFKDAIKGLKTEVNVEGHKLNVDIPSGVRNGTQIKFTGKGENPGSNIPPGDLYLIIQVKEDREIKRANNDTFTEIEIPMSLAALGGTTDIKVVDPDSSTAFSTVKLKIPSGTQPNSQIRIRAKGMPIMGTKSRGDHYVNINIKIPTKLNKDQKRALEELF